MSRISKTRSDSKRSAALAMPGAPGSSENGGQSMAAVLVAVAGQAGAGKSRLAAQISRRIAARRVDVIGDLEPLPATVEYAQAISKAREALVIGSSVVVTGPFHTRDSRRELMRLAGETRAALLYVECAANESVRRRRLRIRALAVNDGPELTRAEADLWVQRLLAEDPAFERVGAEIPRAAQMLVDTTVGIDIWAGLAASRVEAWFAGALRQPGIEDDGQALSAG